MILVDFKKCEDCAWCANERYDNFAKCLFWDCEVWVLSVACNEFSDVGIL